MENYKIYMLMSTSRDNHELRDPERDVANLGSEDFIFYGDLIVQMCRHRNSLVPEHGSVVSGNLVKTFGS